MTTRERVSALLHFQSVDELPVLHAGFWDETIDKWIAEGYLTKEEVPVLYSADDGDFAINGPGESAVAKKLGFDQNIDLFIGGQKVGMWYDMPIYPTFGYDVIETFEDGSYKMRDSDGVYVRCKEGAQGIPSHLGYSVYDRESWEREYLPRLKWNDESLDMELLGRLRDENDTRDYFMSVYCGSLYGKLRNYWGVEEISYLQYEDPDLFKECIDTIADAFYEGLKSLVATGVKFDAGAYWEDICFKNGPLVSPQIFQEYTAHHYRRASDLLNSIGVDISMVDCDGFIEDLVPTWLDNGVNTMFPLEVGTWNADFAKLREKFGKEFRGIGNISKHIFAMDRAAIDAEIERVKKLVDLGGYVPCLDHAIPPSAEWDLVRYYCDRMHEIKY